MFVLYVGNAKLENRFTNKDIYNICIMFDIYSY